ncbi:MAG: calcium/sodium antiporter [Mangrovibacterium sp.]
MSLISYILILLLCFILLARIVDQFFVESLDKISKKLQLSSDAAGATLMAMGSSAPELFVALFSVLKPGEHNDIGIGSIVGSAIFNLLAICGIVAVTKSSKLTWQPIVRDVIFYFLAVVLLLWGVVDGQFSMIDALLFICIYVLYVFAVVHWRKWFPYSDQADDMEEEDKTPLKLDFLDKALTFIMPKPQHYYAVFSVSIVSIAALSWLMVEGAIGIAHITGIPESIIALTILAAGTSVPDLISSVVVAKQGRGDMAISNAIGSNIFDILIGLGLPFLIYILVQGGEVVTQSEDMLRSSLILFGSLALFMFILICNKWKIGKGTGTLLISIYIIYIVYEIALLYLPNLFQ